MNETGIKRSVILERFVKITMAALVLVVSIIFANGIAARAADEDGDSVDIMEINYNTSTITIAVNAKDTMVYLSNDSQKKWEYIPSRVEDRAYRVDSYGALMHDDEGNLLLAEAGQPSKTYKVVDLDISWISFSKNYAISFKGDYSTKPIKAILPKQATNVKATYDIYQHKIKLTNVAEDQTVQWRKKEEIGWNNYDEESFDRTLQTFIDNGTSLVFRTAPVNGTSAENPGKRPSKESSVNIPKRTAAPAITVNDERMTISVKKGLNYRYVDEYGATLSEWRQFTKDEQFPLSEIAADAMYEEAMPAKVLKDVYIQFYQSATSTAQMSKRKTIKIPAQEPLTENDTDPENSKIAYTGKSAFDLIFKTAGESNVLEYCIVTTEMQRLGISLENDITNENLKWNTVNSTTPIGKSLASDSKLVDDGVIYYRRKAQNKLGDSNYKLASPPVQLAEIKYPHGAEVQGFKLLRTIDGMCRNGSNTLNFSFSSGTKGVIKKVEFRTSGGSAGTARFTYTVAENSGEGVIPYTYTVTLTDLSGITKTDTLLYAYVYFGDESSYENASVKSNSTNGIGLYIYPGTKINNPVGETQITEVANKLAAADNTDWSGYIYDNDKVNFETSFKRVYQSNRTSAAGDVDADPTQFRFKLDFGTVDTPVLDTKTSATDCAEYNSADVSVTKLRYDGVDLVPTAENKYFFAEYYTDTETVEGNDREYRVAVITVNTDVIERNISIDDRDKDTPLLIYLSNGEIIRTGITINFQRTATTAELTSFAFTEGTLADYITSTDKNGVTTTERNLSEYNRINLVVPSNLGGRSNYNVNVSTVTWNGSNILYSAVKNGNSITIILDSSLINKLQVGGTSETHDIRIEFTNGYAITSGIPMTISPASH